MNFAHPRVLWLAAVLVPLLGLFLWATWRKRQALVRQFVQHKMLAEISVGSSSARQKWRRVLLLAAVAFLLLAVARPQWGFVWEEATQRGRDIVVAIDTSRSMLAQDVQPNRLARAKLAALDLLKLGQYDRFGLVAFAGTAFLQCPLTFDEEAFRQSVQILEPGILPQGGTAIGAAIDAARGAFGSEGEDNHKVVVLFTDGEDHEQGVMDTVERAANDGVKIFTIGAGTPAGEVLRVRDEQGASVFVKDASGNVVKSRLNEELLRQIATTAHGFYLPLNAANSMETLYQKGLAPMAATERSTKLMKRLNDQFYWPLALAIILLIVEVLIPDQKRAKRRADSASPAAPVSAAAALLLLLLSTAEASGTPASAMRKYKNGEFKGALAEYQELIAKNPDDPRLRYNAGAAAYQANKFDQALEQFQAAAASPDLDLQQQALYNLGNTEFKVGESNSDLKERMASWERALQHFDSALRLNQQDQDAAFNRDLVKRKLEELKQQQQQQKDQQGNPNEDNKDEQKQNEDERKKDNQNDNQNKQDQKDQQEQKDNTQQSSKDQQQQQQKEQEQKQQQQSSNQQDENKPQDSQASKSGGEKESEKNDPQNAEQGQFAQLGKMTPAQARQLLDAQRGEEKALLFIPQDKKGPARDRVFKDW